MSSTNPQAGDLGAPRSGGQAANDAFTNRAAASENMYIRQREAEMAKKFQQSKTSSNQGAQQQQGGSK